MAENNFITLQFTDEQLEIMKKNIENFVEVVSKIWEAMKDIIVEALNWVKEVMNTEIILVKRERKGKRYVPYITKQKLYSYLMRRTI